LERLTDKSPLDHPKHVSALVSALGTYLQKVAEERRNGLPEGSTLFNGLEHVLTSNTEHDTLHRNLLLRRMDLKRLEQSQKLLTELANGLSSLGIERTSNNAVRSDKFPDALRATLSQFGIDVRLERSNGDRSRIIVVTPWSWNSPTLAPALNDPLKEAMDFVVDRLKQAGYPTQWRWRDP
jgi:hypothetical protein